MDVAAKKQLDEVNKLIFVRRYESAAKLLDELLTNESASMDLVVHLRRIELAVKLEAVDGLIEAYAEQAHTSKYSHTMAVALALAEQHAEKVSPDESIARFQEIMQEHGEDPACYYGIAFGLEMLGNVERAIYSYEQSVALDGTWYPSYFGLSQLCYQKGDSQNGDRYFYMFEESAPYNVYGNFDTHRRLYKEFLERGEFTEAEIAISALSDWWVENKGQCPAEIRLYEKLVAARLANVQNHDSQAETHRQVAVTIAEEILFDADPQESILYFCAKVLEEFDEYDLAFKFYKKVLRVAGDNPTMVQKIGSQFLSLGEFENAKELFTEAYYVHPDNPEIRFCLLVSKLKVADINVEEYLIGKERLKQLVSSGSDKVELLALLHSLMAKFQEDPDVQYQIADIYLRLGNVDRAMRHFDSMHEIDPASKVTTLRYVSFIMQHGDSDKAMELLDQVVKDRRLTTDELTEINWLRANYHARCKEFVKAQDFLSHALRADPWNVSYLIQEIINLQQLTDLDEDYKAKDPVLSKLAVHDESELEWHTYDAMTEKFEAAHAYNVVYSRRKLRFLYTTGDDQHLSELIASAIKFDPSRGTYDFVRLLNTNFDSSAIYTALGLLYKELWQLEVASMWFEQSLMHPRTEESEKAFIYSELSDCYIWLGTNPAKAVEFAKLALEIGEQPPEGADIILAHALLKHGDIQSAEKFLSNELESNETLELQYLRGLLEYRNGAHKKANKIWKPLLTVRTESIRSHNIKQEILRYYFENVPYLKVN